uniref:Uncharacterized protein n=1 Tax=Stomoxys calcitrans TaxID=35570 RepID=A0A1I8QBG7_STOCA
MAFKTFYCVLLLFFLTFTMVKGSCLEYGHSCWGAHGKRSSDTKIHRADKKPPTELDFADLNAAKESNFESSEDHVKPPYDTMSQPNHDVAKTANDLSNEMNNEKVLKLENLLLKQLKANGKHHATDETRSESQHFLQPGHKSNTAADSYLNERWRRLPLYNFRRYPMANGDKWLNDLESEQTRNMDETADYI